MADEVQVWQGAVGGHAHRVEARGTTLHRVRWLVDGQEVVEKKEPSDTVRLRHETHGRLTVRFSGLGRPRRATVHHGDKELGGTDLVPAPGSQAAAHEQRLLEHPTRTAVLAGVGSAGGVVAGLAGAALAAYLLRFLPDLPSIASPDLPDLPDLPSIPFPDLPDLPSIPFPDLPDLPGWVRYVVPVVVAVVLAVTEVRRRRTQEEERTRARVSGTVEAVTESSQPAPSAVPSYDLNDGTSVPAIGFGTYPLKGEDGTTAILGALEAGYRLIDTAVNYENETEVGEALRRSGLARDDYRVTSKIPGRHHGHDEAIASTEESLRRLGLDHLDVHLIHWPNPSVGRYVEAWTALVELQQRGLVRTIGVSNFTEQHLTEIIEATGVTPALNQVEMHPRFPQAEMRAVHERLGIRTEAWSPMGKARAPYDEAPVVAAAERLGVTPGQVVLRWHVQLGSLPVPKSADPGRQRENLDVFGFELTDDEVAAITGLGEPDGRLFGGDPETHEEM